MTNTTQFNFRVEVDITTTPATYSYIDSQGDSCDGSVTVTEHNTQITYTLSTHNLIFLDPSITGDTGGDLTFLISSNKQTITITDSDADNENACLVLVVAEAANPNVPYPSPDPSIRNRPPT